MKRFLIPFGKDDKLTRILSVVIVPVLFWTILPNHVFPPLTDILTALPKLITKNNLIDNFLTSIFFCFKCVLYSVGIAFIFFVIAQIPIFKLFSEFCRKFRFLPSVGLSFLFMKMTSNVDQQMTWIMVFGVATYLIDSAVSLALSITQEQVQYAKSLRLTPLQALRELVIYGKLADFMAIVIQNFAIAWMLLASVENICKSSGGIGVVLAESSKYMKLEEVYAIQILILFTGIMLDWVLNKVRDFLFPYTKLKRI